MSQLSCKLKLNIDKFFPSDVNATLFIISSTSDHISCPFCNSAKLQTDQLSTCLPKLGYVGSIGSEGYFWANVGFYIFTVTTTQHFIFLSFSFKFLLSKTKAYKMFYV